MIKYVIFHGCKETFVDRIYHNLFVKDGLLKKIKHNILIVRKPFSVKPNNLLIKHLIFHRWKDTLFHFKKNVSQLFAVMIR